MTGQGLTTQQVKQAFQRTRRYSNESGCDFEQWLIGERAEALRDTAALVRMHWSGLTSLPDINDPEVAYSFDRWLEVLADTIELAS